MTNNDVLLNTQKRVNDGEEAAYNQLFEHYYQELLEKAKILTGNNREDAEDLLHNTYISLSIKRNKIKNITHNTFKNYFKTSLHHAFIDTLRKNKSKQQGMFDIIDDDRCDGGVLSKHIDAKDVDFSLIYKIIDELNPDLRECFLLRLKDMKFIDIAHITKSSINTSLGRYRYALLNIRNSLKQMKKFNELRDAYHNNNIINNQS